MNASRLLGILVLVLGLLGPAYAVDDPRLTPVKVTVDLGKSVGTVPELGMGLGVAVWDDHMNRNAVRVLPRVETRPTRH